MSGDAARQVRILTSDVRPGSTWHAPDEKILQAALELFSERGFHGTTTRAWPTMNSTASRESIGMTLVSSAT